MTGSSSAAKTRRLRPIISQERLLARKTRALQRKLAQLFPELATGDGVCLGRRLR